MSSREQDAEAYPCIIDLRAFAAQVCGRGMLRDRTDFLGARHFVDLPKGCTSLGLIELDAAAGCVDRMLFDEFILILQGEVRIDGAAQFILHEGESAVLPKNSSFAWKTNEPAVLAFIRQESSTLSRRHPVKIDPTRPREASPPLADGLVIGEMPEAFRHFDFLSDDELFAAAGWNSNGYARRPFKYEFFELMHLLQGSVALTDREGTEHVFHKGDVVVVRKGGEVAWHSTVPVTKVAAVCRA